MSIKARDAVQGDLWTCGATRRQAAPSALVGAFRRNAVVRPPLHELLAFVEKVGAGVWVNSLFPSGHAGHRTQR